MSRTARWEFFLTRWAQLYDLASGAVKVTRDALVPQLSKQEAARLDIVIQKAVRAKQILQQLQDTEAKHAQLQQQHQPLVSQLPIIQQQLSGEVLAKATEFAKLEGLREPVVQVTGQASVPSAQLADPFGIRIAFRPGHPLSLVTWREYLQLMQRVGQASRQMMSGSSWEQMVGFHRARQQLVRELECLKDQLEEEVEIPQLQPLREDCEQLENLIQGVLDVQEAHLNMLKTDLAQLDLNLLELKLKLREGDAYKSSPVAAAVQRLKRLHAAASQASEQQQQQQQQNLLGQLPYQAWTQLADDLDTLAQHVRQRKQTEEQLEVSIQKYQRQVFARLAQLQQEPAAVGDG